MKHLAGESLCPCDYCRPFLKKETNANFAVSQWPRFNELDHPKGVMTMWKRFILRAAFGYLFNYYERWLLQAGDERRATCAMLLESLTNYLKRSRHSTARYIADLIQEWADE